MSFQIFLLVIFCAGACLGENTNICENKQNLNDVRIPQGQLFTKEDFNNFVIGVTLREAYVLLPDPAHFTVSSNYNCEITAVDDTTFQRVCTGLEPNCTEYNLTLSMVSQGNGISFSYTDPSDNAINDYYWSPCPSEFILRIQCPAEILLLNNKCPITGARITPCTV